MAIKTFRVHVSTTAGTDIIDITPEIERIAAQAREGAVLLFVPGSTAALTTIDQVVKTRKCLFFRRARKKFEGKARKFEEMRRTCRTPQ